MSLLFSTLLTSAHHYPPCKLHPYGVSQFVKSKDRSKACDTEWLTPSWEWGMTVCREYPSCFIEKSVLRIKPVNNLCRGFHDPVTHTFAKSLLRAAKVYFHSLRSQLIVWSVFNTMTLNNFLLQLKKQSTLKTKPHLSHTSLTNHRPLVLMSGSCLFFWQLSGQNHLNRLK